MLTEISGIYKDCSSSSILTHIRFTVSKKKKSLLPCTPAQLMVEFPCGSLRNNGFIVNMSLFTEGSLMPTMSPAWTGMPGGEGILYSMNWEPTFTDIHCESFVMLCCQYKYKSSPRNPLGVHVVICGMSAVSIDSGMLLFTLSVQLVI